MRFAYAKPSGEVVWVERSYAEGPPPRAIEANCSTCAGHGRLMVVGAPPVACSACAGVGSVPAKRSYQSESKGGKSTKGWPLTCYASGVHPEQAQALRDEFKRTMGADAPEVTKGGDPVYRDAGHRRRALKARGMFDRAAFY